MIGPRLLTFGFISCFALLGWASTMSAPRSPASPQRRQEAAVARRLDEEVIVEGYRLRPPRNYVPIQQEGAEGINSYGWVGAVRKDGTRPTLMLNLSVPPAEEAQQRTLEQTANELLKGVKRLRTNWKQTPAVKTTIHGLTFVRVRWSATESKHKRRMQGFLYAGRDGNTLVVLASQDVEPHAAQALLLAEAAAQTFQRPSSRVFFSIQWPDHAQIYSMNPNGSDRVCLTPRSDSDYHPSLSPDGKTIAFTTHRDGVRALYLMDADGTNPRRLTEKEDAGQCSWSPDGSKIAFSSNRDGRYCIYVMNADGSSLRRLTNGPSEDWPTWSPDGRQIAYEGMQDRTWRIFLVKVDGSGIKPVTQGKWNDRWPQWSPDGETIAFTSFEQGNGDIYLMRPNGANATRLTSNPAEDRQPSWTADGREILFHSNRAGHFDIFVLDLNTLDERRLTTETKDTAEATTLGRSRLDVN